MACINRHIEQRIAELSKKRSAILLTRPRQSGKDTMLKNLDEKLRQKTSAERYLRGALPAVQRRRNTSKRYVFDFIKGSG